jgi:hypothetical protein
MAKSEHRSQSGARGAISKKAAAGIGTTLVVIVVVLVARLFGIDASVNEDGSIDWGAWSAQGEQVLADAERDDAVATAPGPQTTAASPAPGPQASSARPAATPSNNAPKSDDDLVARSFKNGDSDVMVTIVARVVKVLPPDTDGKPHQKFIIRLDNRMTLLVAHNLTLAPEVPLAEGDSVTIRGEYEWSDKGGVVHWTHHDPKKWREGGWIEHEGERYE